MVYYNNFTLLKICRRSNTNSEKLLWYR